MLKVPASATSYHVTASAHTPAMAGVLIGTAISLLLWLMIAAIVFAVR